MLTNSDFSPFFKEIFHIFLLLLLKCIESLTASIVLIMQKMKWKKLGKCQNWNLKSKIGCRIRNISHSFWKGENVRKENIGKFDNKKFFDTFPIKACFKLDQFSLTIFLLIKTRKIFQGRYCSLCFLF